MDGSTQEKPLVRMISSVRESAASQERTREREERERERQSGKKENQTALVIRYSLLLPCSG